MKRLKIGGAEEDRTPDLLIANGKVIYKTRHFNQSIRLSLKPGMALYGTNLAQSCRQPSQPGERP